MKSSPACGPALALALLISSGTASAGESALGSPPEVYVAQFRTWAAESDGMFFASCMVRPGKADEAAAYLILPRARTDGNLVFLSSGASGRRLLVNAGSVEIRDGAVKIGDIAQGGVGSVELTRRVAAALLAASFKVSFSLEEILTRQPTENCALAPDR